MSSEHYVKESIRNVNKRIKGKNMEFKNKLSDINYSSTNIYSTV